MDIFERIDNANIASYRIPGDYTFALVNVTDPDGALFTSEYLLFRSFSLQKKANFQAMPALDSTTYIYTFGSSDGNLVVSGLAFEGTKVCSNGSTNSASGLSDIINFYEKFNINRVESRGKLPKLNINILGGPSFSGFLTGYQAQPNNGFDGLVSFSLNILLIDEVEFFKLGGDFGLA